ncbi:MAG: phosphatase PAP2 family protein [Gammaproteobacteria bacterium]|nr:phosphatase PAP2 family protein [Gammaproteobacteria bacterium]
MKKQLLLVVLVLFVCGKNAFAVQYESFGDAVQYALPLTALGMTFTEDDPEGRMQFVKSFGATFGITYSVKLGVNRTRPNGADYSFPSGHTSASFSSASYIHQRYGIKKGRIAYFAAAFVGWTRVQANKHYVSDVLAGAAVGSLTSYMLTSNKDMNLSGYKDKDSTGINIQYRW